MTILYVDADEEDRGIFCEVVSNIDNVDCITASDGRAALEILKTDQVDVILFDYRAPSLNANKFLEELNNLSKSGRELQIYLYGSFLQDFEKAKCRDLGVIDCFEKPYSVEQITRLVKRFAEKKSSRKV